MEAGSTPGEGSLGAMKLPHKEGWLWPGASCLGEGVCPPCAGAWGWALLGGRMGPAGRTPFQVPTGWAAGPGLLLWFSQRSLSGKNGPSEGPRSLSAQAAMRGREAWGPGGLGGRHHFPSAGRGAC